MLDAIASLSEYARELEHKLAAERTAKESAQKEAEYCRDLLLASESEHEDKEGRYVSYCFSWEAANPKREEIKKELIEQLRRIGGGEGCLAYLKEYEVDRLLTKAADALEGIAEPADSTNEGGD